MAKKLADIPEKETERILAKVLGRVFEQVVQRRPAPWGHAFINLEFEDTDLFEELQQEGYILEISEFMKFFEKIVERLNAENPHFRTRVSREYGNPSDHFCGPNISLFVSINPSAWGKLPNQVLDQKQQSTEGLE